MKKMHSVLFGAALAFALFGNARAQTAPDAGLSVGATAAGTYYCIVSRCNTGAAFGVAAAVDVTPVLSLTLDAAYHACSDCHSFYMGDASVRARYPSSVVRPFVSAGLSHARDPEFFGSRTGVIGAAGIMIVPASRWRGDVQIRGRRVGRGDALGEISLSLMRKFPN